MFKYIYGNCENWNVVPAESPDFVCVRNNKTVLGVEITELYPNESDARLEKVSGYCLDLLDGKEVIHKDDKKNLRVERITYFKKDKSDGREINAIIHEGISFGKKVSRFQEVVNRKEKKTNSYLSSCPIVDLIVNDASYMFRFDNYKDFVIPFSMLIDKATIIESGFREIYIITLHKNNKIVWIPLKLNLFAQEIYIYEKLVADLGKPKDDIKKFLNILLFCLYKSGFGSIPIIIENGNIGFFVGNSEYLYTKAGKIIREYSTLPESVPSGKVLKEAIKKISDFEKEAANELIKEKQKWKCHVELFFEPVIQSLFIKQCERP